MLTINIEVTKESTFSALISDIERVAGYHKTMSGYSFSGIADALRIVADRFEGDEIDEP